MRFIAEPENLLFMYGIDSYSVWSCTKLYWVYDDKYSQFYWGGVSSIFLGKMEFCILALFSICNFLPSWKTLFPFTELTQIFVCVVYPMNYSKFFLRSGLANIFLDKTLVILEVQQLLTERLTYLQSKETIFLWFKSIDVIINKINYSQFFNREGYPQYFWEKTEIFSLLHKFPPP